MSTQSQSSNHYYAKSDTDLVTYLAQRWRFLKTYRDFVESKLQDDMKELLNTIGDHKANNSYDEVTEKQADLNYDIQTRRIQHPHRYLILVAICSFLEEAVVLIAKRSLTDSYSEKLKNAKKEHEKLGVAEKHLAMLLDESDALLDRLTKARENIRSYIALRNCIVHSWGNIPASGNPDKVKNAIFQLHPTNSPGNHLLEEASDGFLVFTDQLNPSASYDVEYLIDHLTKKFFNESLTEKQDSLNHLEFRKS